MKYKQTKLPHRIRVLMAIVQELSEVLTNDNLHKLLFLYCHGYACNAVYYFLPVRGNPYSLQAIEDRKWLIKAGLLQDVDGWHASISLPRIATQLDMFEKLALQSFKNAMTSQEDKKYEKAWADYSATEPERQCSASDQPVLYTIGYEGLSVEQYINTLLYRRVQILCDVRRNAFSQKYGFSKNELEAALRLVGIQYRHIPVLGIISEHRQNLQETGMRYNLLKQYEESLPSKIDHLSELQTMMQKHKRIAITCFEQNPRACHRSKITKWMAQNKPFEYKVEHL